MSLPVAGAVIIILASAIIMLVQMLLLVLLQINADALAIMMLSQWHFLFSDMITDHIVKLFEGQKARM